MEDLKSTLNMLASGQHFSQLQTRLLFDFMVSGQASATQVGALLMGLRLRGETIDEIVGAAHAMRARMLPVRAPAGAIDIVGTGGDGLGTYNISTAAAFVVAGAGVVVAKHGNRAVSSQSGAADVLAALGVEISPDPCAVERCLSAAKFGFMFAPAHHPALKQVMPARIELGIRTIFNILGPLLNPAGVRHHLVGVYSRELLEPMACAFRELGSDRALIVHGRDGLDEISTTGPTSVAMLANNTVKIFELTPEQVGLKRVPLSSLQGGSAVTNAKALCEMLAGQCSPYRDIVLFNAAGALIAAGVVADWPAAMELARVSVDKGNAQEALRRMVVASREPIYN